MNKGLINKLMNTPFVAMTAPPANIRTPALSKRSNRYAVTSYFGAFPGGRLPGNDRALSQPPSRVGSNPTAKASSETVRANR